MASTFAEIGCSLRVSSYKWLSNNLLAAQQNYNVRPFFKAKVVDDTVPFAGTFTRPPYTGGTLVTAPDGSILGAGLDVSGNVVFYKASPTWDFYLDSWETTHTLEASGGTFANAQNRYVISVSDWIGGSYHIDVFYFFHFTNDSSDLQVKHWYSDDGGASWTSATFSPTFTFPSSHYDPGYGGTIPNLSICALKPRNINGTVFNGFAYINPNNNSFPSGELGYDILYYYGDPLGGYNNVFWSARNVNSNDWSLHSLDSFYWNGVDYFVFSGFRNFIDSPNTLAPSPNYGLWLTSLPVISGLITTDLWTAPVSLFSSIAVTYINQNSFTFPTTTIINGTINVTFRAVTVDSYSPSASGSKSTVVTTHLNYMMMQSVDALNFTYPSIFVETNGTEFNDSPNTQRNASYTDFGVQRWLGGQTTMWEFIKNNVVADVSGDVVQYTIQEAAGQPSSITIQIANQNNDWVGASPTNPGASAISGNKKIVLLQGFYTSDGTPETVPRNIYFIDDIHQNVSATSNDVTLQGRDLYKNLKTLVSKYSFSWLGPFLYADIFDGSTISNWNQQSGSWEELFLAMTLTTYVSDEDEVITLSNVPAITYGSTIVVGINAGNGSGEIHVYAYYIDSDNWLRLKYVDNVTTWTVERRVAGTTTAMDTGTISLPFGTTFGVVIRQYDWYKFNFMVQTGTGVTNGYNGIGAFTGSGGNLTLLKNSTTGEFDLSSYVPTNATQKWSVGLGSRNMIPIFRYFKYAQYNTSNNVKELIKAIATKASIFYYNFQNAIAEYFFAASNFSILSSPVAFTNRILQIGASGLALYTQSQTANGEFTFQAKVTPTAAGNYGFSFRFRDDNAGSQYRFHVQNKSGFVHVYWERLYSSTVYTIGPQSATDCFTNSAALGGLQIDLTKVHTYKVVFFDGWMMAFIDGIMVGAWNDNTTTTSYLTTGYWGWQADSNSNLLVYQVLSTSFWKQTPSFSINPGDDMESDALSVIQSIRAWFFSDLWGYLKAIFLSSSDASTYTYQNQLSAQGVDNSNKEYVSQVTVYGSGVSATARATSLMNGVSVREEVIVDYTITTQEDAQTRANNELINANQYQNQWNPKQTMNVGAEILDAVTVVDTGNNSSGVNGPTRVYAQKLTTGGDNNEFSVELDTGNL